MTVYDRIQPTKSTITKYRNRGIEAKVMSFEEADLAVVTEDAEMKFADAEAKMLVWGARTDEAAEAMKVPPLVEKPKKVRKPRTKRKSEQAESELVK